MFKQALAVGKLVSPDADHTAVADGLAESQFGQGKVCGGDGKCGARKVWYTWGSARRDSKYLLTLFRWDSKLTTQFAA